MPNFIQTIKRAALDAVRASKPCEVTFGSVLHTSPLTVSVDQKIKLSGDTLMCLDSYNNDMAVGDTVVLLRVQGGQRFVVLGKAVST